MKTNKIGLYIVLALLITPVLATGFANASSEVQNAFLVKPVKKTVSITNPVDGSTASGTVTITVTTSDGTTPDIYIGETLVTHAFSYDWDTTGEADGSQHIIKAQLDRKTNDEVTVTVDNGGTPPPEGMPWWNDAIDVEKAHAAGYTGSGTVVVIIDTGLGSNWETLFPSENILTQYCMSQTKEKKKDRVAWNQDTEGHGTACTATVIGYYLNDQFVTGVAPDAKIVMIRTIYWVGGLGRSAVTETEMLNAWAEAIDYARDLHAGDLSSYNMIVSMSLGYDNTNANLNNAVDGAEAEGIVVVTSAGNAGHETSTTAYPANLADTTSVAAAGWDGYTEAYGIDGIFGDIPEDDFSGLHIADFSSGGKVDVTGIGENMVLPQVDGYYYMSGTSFSCPQTAGVFALMFQAWGSQSVQWFETKMQDSCYWGSGMTSFVWGTGFIQADAATA
ncbi:MAG: S8 family serine peptidase [Candidatus Heimdallarchaeota archaeon]|nr:S8 family serine peptidase [Candidatus Heimdallarchaeota archaeon]MCK5047960.1 S8 family serine peptidase [Candidatus Heimdallarchaeota archaeon]